MKRPCALGVVLSASLLVAVVGCGGEQTYTCNPTCPAGSHCEASGCVPDGPGADLTAVAVDGGSDCSPACGGDRPFCNANKVCSPCLKDGDCKAGLVCKTVGNTSACVPGCADDTRCAGTDASSCCGGQCVDATRDPNNCGGCGKVCAAPHARSSCTGGACKVTGCDSAWSDCNNDPADGCEVYLAGDEKNCGACGMACSFPNALAGCADGCYIRACTWGFDDCNAMAADGCETNVLNNNTHCGACGMPCAPVPHGRNTCQNGGCQVTSCDAGYLDCDGQRVNGCEVNLNTDAQNCGACGIKCAPGLVCAQGLCTCPQCNLPNAKSTCVNLKCAVASCNFGFGDCDAQPQNGCETTLANDAKNCGQCGNICAQGLVCTNGGCTCPQCNFANASSKCVNNVCQLDKCNPLWGNCNGNPVDGCELDLSADTKNCGACGIVCPQNLPFCVAGACTAAPPCGGWDNGNGCWYTTALGQSCNSFCMNHGGFDSQRTQHNGNPICTHFYPMKANGGVWVTVECCSTDNNTNWGANNMVPDGNFTHPACYLACACNN